MKTPSSEPDGSIRNTQLDSNLDWWYGGGEAYWPDLATALLNINEFKRKTLTIGILNGTSGLVEEYWWPNPANLKDHHVALKQVPGEGGADLTNYYTKTQVDDLIEDIPLGGSVTDLNTATGIGAIGFWTGTQAEYNAIGTKANNVLYFVVP